MTLVLDLPDHLERRLIARAAKAGQTVEEYIVALLERALAAAEEDAVRPIVVHGRA